MRADLFLNFAEHGMVADAERQVVERPPVPKAEAKPAKKRKGKRK